MSKNEKFFVFQTKQDGTQVEVGRKLKGPGRPPVGPNIMNADDGNIYVTDVLLEEPKNASSYIEVELEDITIWYQKLKSAPKHVIKRYSLDDDGNLVDEGPAGRGRPKTNYVKIDTDLIVDGVNLNGHFYNNGEEVVSKPKAVSKPKLKPQAEDDYEEYEDVVAADDIEDAVASDDELEAQALADAAADFAADGGEFEEVEFEEVV